MIEVHGISNETLVLDGEWFEVLRASESKARLPAASFVSVEIEEIARKKKLFGGEREELIQATLTFDRPPFVGFITQIEKRDQLQAVLDGLAAARDAD
jgi:hypothetical protein